MPKKALWIAARIVGVVLLVGIVFAITNKGVSSINNTMTQYDTKMSQYDDMAYTMLGSTISGNEIIDMIQDIKNDGVSFVVTNGSGKPKTYNYATVMASDSTDLKNIKNKSMKEYYINPTASFETSITRDENDIITTVRFTQIR